MDENGTTDKYRLIISILKKKATYLIWLAKLNFTFLIEIRNCIICGSKYNWLMRFTWDENKRQLNLGKHGFDFVDASQVFEGVTFTFEDERYAYGEQRFITLELLRRRVVVIAHTEVGDEIRVISMREGTKREQIIFFQSLSN
ncbi:BrnT family toxin [Komarekiella delphini-convector]|nr:BrnT family toxin [Komarekiella delphini-convector]